MKINIKEKASFVILTLLILALLAACVNDNNNETQNDSPALTTHKVPAATAFELPATPEPMESPILPDEDNVSLPDPD